MAAIVEALRQRVVKAVPFGYTPGLLVARVRQDLHQLEYLPTGNANGRFRAPSGDLEFEIEEQTESHLLMYIVNAAFLCRLGGAAGDPARIDLRHKGLLKRKGLETVRRAGATDAASIALARRIDEDAPLAAILAPLDFTRFELRRDSQGWQARVLHYGACEVVHRLPASRRYVGFRAEQASALQDGFRRLQGLFNPPHVPA